MSEPFRMCFGRLRSAVAAVSRRLNDNAGNATLELALSFGVLVTPLLLGASETAFMIYDSIEVSNAAHAGAMYGMYSSTNAQNSSDITLAAQSDAPDIANLQVTPSYYFACSTAPDGASYATQALANQNCTGSSHSLEFVAVDTTAQIQPPIHIPGLPSTWTLRGHSVMEVQD